MNKIKLRHLLQQFFVEDLGEGDVTSNTIFNLDDIGDGQFIVKQDGIVSGIDIIKEAYLLFDEEITVQNHVIDGDNVKKGDCIATVRGPISHLLSGERVILNLLQRMSGIATLTKEAVDTLNSATTRVCDTRKTTPGLRMFEKYAVRCGGGFNHRIGLYDGVMIKDNHIAASGSITEAVQKVKEQLGHMVKVEVETETKEQVLEAIEAKADIIMFDNRTPEQVAEFVKLVPEGFITEASGGIDLTNLAGYSNTGVHYISLGLLTHSVKALDISFNVQGGTK
ncbi:carboxylating nicotinate-nucleotide diphosphorylase [Bacillus sp. FJAT-45350]|uniref:carboxylating nicotinate-nucleotide diphosphorylase n=1 Tax=Bacillus sp. FJAT-45350 TaxID=2011014 RepID=UPI000BB87B54|nr:carboxylating nicotinate-nucleotide diphosphorylase [Bacillus sp. FJAT-45350]